MEQDLIRLDEVCHLFGVSKETARRWAAIGKLPVPAFRLSNSQKGPLYVKREDLDALISTRRSDSAKAALAIRSVT